MLSKEFISKKLKMKICFVLSHLPQGGAERQTINLIRKLVHREFDVTLVLYANQEIFYEEIHELNVHIISCPAYSKSKLIKNLKGAIFLRKILSQNDFDLIHTLLFHNGLWVRLLAPAKYSGRIIYSIRNSLEQSSFFERSVEKLLHGRSVTVTNSHFVLEQYKKIVGDCSSESCLTIYNGIETYKFISDESPNLGKYIVIGTIGRQTLLKNHIQLLRVVKELRHEVPLHLYIIGDSDQDCFKANSEYINLNGLDNIVTILDSQQDIENYYKKFNIFVLSSLSESCPNVLFEAMLAKCLCVVSQGSNKDRFIIDGLNGFEYDGTDQMLKEKLILATQKLEMHSVDSILINAQNYVLENFSINNMVNSYTRLYFETYERAGIK